jgi:hypothetical protein
MWFESFVFYSDSILLEVNPRWKEVNSYSIDSNDPRLDEFLTLSSGCDATSGKDTL